MIGGKNHLDALVKLGGFKFTDTFLPYTSGKIGPYYVQGLAITRDGLEYRKVIDSLIDLIQEKVSDDFDIISGGESKDWAFSYPISTSLKKPHLTIYKNQRISGASPTGRKVTPVADINNTGYSPSGIWIPSIRNLNGEVDNVFFYIDRMEGGRESIKELGVESHALIELDQNSWEYLRRHENISKVTQEVYKNIVERRENQDEWAKGMLKSDNGFAELKKLYIDKENKWRAEKILSLGYPDLKDELTERLNGSNNSC